MSVRVGILFTLFRARNGVQGVGETIACASRRRLGSEGGTQGQNQSTMNH
jgi:hypothetical protein